MTELHVAMKHEACGGNAELIILLDPGHVTYRVQCPDCGYSQTWDGGQGSPRILH